MAGLQLLRTRYDGEWPVVTFPDGSEARADDPRVDALLTAYVGRPVALRREDRISHFDEGPLHLVSTATLAAIGDPDREVDARRLRPNVVLELHADGTDEELWAGRRVRVGTALVEVLYAMPRCVMLDHEQAELPPADGLLRTVTARRDGTAGVVADVVEAGTLRIGDDVVLTG
jgi:uncharacterized protein YcbX